MLQYSTSIFMHFETRFYPFRTVPTRYNQLGLFDNMFSTQCEGLLGEKGEGEGGRGGREDWRGGCGSVFPPIGLANYRSITRNISEAKNAQDSSSWSICHQQAKKRLR